MLHAVNLGHQLDITWSLYSRSTIPPRVYWLSDSTVWCMQFDPVTLFLLTDIIYVSNILGFSLKRIVQGIINCRLTHHVLSVLL